MAIIKVKRDYSGQEGVGPDKDVLAGTTHSVTRARAAELKANGLVEIISDEAHPDDEADDAASGEKKIDPIVNKAAPRSPNKKATKAVVKRESAAADVGQA